MIALNPSVRVRETLRGTFFLLASPEEDRSLRIVVDVEIGHWLDFAKNIRCDAEGEAELEGVASRADITGVLRFHLLRERRIPYELSFKADDGRRLTLVGQKEWVPAAPFGSLFSMAARIFDEAGVEVGRAALRPSSRHPFWSLLASVRWSV